MKDIEKKFKEPFSKNELEFRVGATNTDKTLGLALAYVSARAIQNRLDNTVGFDNWKTEYKEVNGGYICALSIRINEEWITKEDGASMTEFETVKGGISNAFKRVASSGFGIGRYLYDLENRWYPIKKQGSSYIFTETPRVSINQTSNRDNLLREPNNANNEYRSNVVLTFGKYKGRTIKEVFEKDIKYIGYLLDNSKDQEIIEECRTLLKKGA